jgi:hypothetical protein
MCPASFWREALTQLTVSGGLNFATCYCTEGNPQDNMDGIFILLSPEYSAGLRAICIYFNNRKRYLPFFHVVKA